MKSNKTSNNPNTLVTGDAEKVISGVLSWLTNPNGSKHCTVTGGPGAGKTWLIKDLLATHRSFKKLGIIASPSLQVCGTTHDSLGVISKFLDDDSLRTMYSILQLVPVKGVIHKRFGSRKLAAKYDPKPEEIDNTEYRLICDESNFVSQETLTIIDKWFPNAKIIYIGSENQLGTESGPSKIFTQGYTNFFLDTSFRSDNAEVQEVYDNSEQDVIDGASNVTYTQNPSVVYLNGPDWEAMIKKAYTSDNAHNCITLAHTNKRVFELVGMIREAQGRPGYFDLAGPTQALRAGSGQMPKKKVPLRRDHEGKVYVPIKTEDGHKKSYVGETYSHYEHLQSKNHKRQIDEIYPSLVASMEASTIHGAQGGTWDYTFLDLTNLYPLKLRDIETYRRAKHVGESRHRKKLFVKLN